MAFNFTNLKTKNMIKLRKLKKHEKNDFPKAVAVISVGKEAPYEGILTQEDINKLQEQVKLFAIPNVSVAKREFCPKCGKDSLITMSDGVYCMDDWCSYYRANEL